MTTPPNKAQVTLSSLDRLSLERALYQKSFVDFVKRAWQEVDPAPLVWNWHLDVLCAALQAVAEGRSQQLLINVPPGTAKSRIVSVLYPAWMWTRNPSWKAVSLSHNHGQATRDTRASRTVINSEWYQHRWPITFVDDQNQKGGYENTAFGARTAVAFGSATGHRGDAVIIDDPHSVAMAKSDLERAATVETFWDALSNRLNDLKSGVIIVIMQRLHEEDVAGSILEKDVGYDHLCLPMEYEGDTKIPKCVIDPLTGKTFKDPRKRMGQLLFPAKFDRTEINKLKKKYHPTTYAGQYQQRPSPKEAGEIDIAHFQRFTPGTHPKGCNYYMTSDHAPSSHGDYNVFRIWGLDHNRNLYLVDSFRDKCKMLAALGLKDESGKLVMSDKGALPMLKKWKPLCFFPEDDNTWKALEGLFIQAMREHGLFVRIEPQPTGGADKVAKAQPYSTLAGMGQIYLPRGPVGDAALLEYSKFPTGKHDDQVDADGMIARVFDQLIPGWIYKTDEEEDVIKGYGLDKSDTANDSDSFWS